MASDRNASETAQERIGPSQRSDRVPVRVAVGERTISASVSPANEAAIWIAFEDAWHEAVRRITAKGGRL